MDALACIDFLDLNDTASRLADRVNRMNANAAITNKPGHHELSHREAPIEGPAKSQALSSFGQKSRAIYAIGQ